MDFETFISTLSQEPKKKPIKKPRKIMPKLKLTKVQNEKNKKMNSSYIRKGLQKGFDVNLNVRHDNNNNYNKLIVNVTSETSTDIYPVTILNTSNGFNMSCECGVKYGVGIRHDCKHITGVSINILQHVIKTKLNKMNENDKPTIDDLLKRIDTVLRF